MAGISDSLAILMTILVSYFEPSLEEIGLGEENAESNEDSEEKKNK